MTNFKDKIWAEKYRPTEMDDYIFPSEKMMEMEREWESNGIFPNLVLSGIQGTGKSSFGGLLIRKFKIDGNEILRINGSTKNKLEVVRETIEPFCQMKPIYGDYKVVVIEEAHRLTKDAQQALFDTIEKFLYVRFIFTTNYVKKLEAPLVSRCTSFDFNEHDREMVIDRLVDICEAEEQEGNIEIDEADNGVMDRIEAHYSKYEPDIRATINSLQQSITNKIIGMPDTGTSKTESFESWVECWTVDSFDFGVILSLTDGIDNNNYGEYYQVMFSNIPTLMTAIDREDLIGESIIDLSDYLFKAMNNVSESAIQRIHLEAFIYRFQALINDGE